MSGIVLDSSAVIAMLEGEPEAARLRAAFVAAAPRWIGAVAAIECQIVLERRRGALGKSGFDTLIDRFDVRVLPFDDLQIREAHVAYHRFGKGRHPAALNLGDCCAYASARALRLPLLQKGDDLARTDLPLAPW